MALIAMTRPRRLVELGTHWGTSYCAFCQAVKELRLSTACFAVDTWQGDSHAGYYTSEVLDNLAAHHNQHYTMFSELVRSTFDDAMPRFADKSIDILHIDGLHTYEAVAHDFETWLPKVSDRGVVLLHDIEVRDRPGFGVWRFWDEIKQRYPHFAFHHSHGLGVLAVGRNIPAALRDLVTLTPEREAEVRTYFASLGDRVEELQSAVMQREDLEARLKAKTSECARVEARLEAKTSECARLEASLEALTVRSARIRYRMVDKLFGAVRLVPLLPRIGRVVARLAAPPILRARRMLALGHAAG
jgi:predicted O-methyltransferase YrrM